MKWRKLSRQAYLGDGIAMESVVSLQGINKINNLQIDDQPATNLANLSATNL